MRGDSLLRNIIERRMEGKNKGKTLSDVIEMDEGLLQQAEGEG